MAAASMQIAGTAAAAFGRLDEVDAMAVSLRSPDAKAPGRTLKHRRCAAPVNTEFVQRDVKKSLEPAKTGPESVAKASRAHAAGDDRDGDEHAHGEDAEGP